MVQGILHANSSIFKFNMFTFEYSKTKMLIKSKTVFLQNFTHGKNYLGFHSGK